MIKRAIVTGGSSGLGLEIAKKLVKRNIQVMIIGRNKEKLNHAVGEIGSNVSSFSVDISCEDQVKDFMKDCSEVDYLFNVAGNGVFGDVREVSRKDIDDVLASNLVGMILMTSNLLKINRGPLKIFNIMSTAARKGKKDEEIYCAAKFGARGFTEALQARYKGSNIHVTGIFPGGMATDFWAKQDRDIETFMDPKDVADQIVKIVDEDKTYTSELVIERP